MFKIELVLDVKGNVSSRKLSALKLSNPQAYNDLIKRTGFLDSNSNLIERVYCIQNNITSIPSCKACGKPTKYTKSRRQFSPFCSIKCSANFGKTISKRKATLKQNYGVESPLRNKELLTKAKRTTKRRYGVENVSQSKEVKSKKKQTCLSNFGVEHPMQSQKVRSKSKDTLLKRYGVSSPMHIPEIKQKVIESSKNTFLSKFGVDNYSYVNIDYKIYKFLKNKEKLKKWLTIQHHKLKRSHKQIAKLLNVSPSVIDGYCSSLNIHTKYYNNISTGQEEIFQYLKSITDSEVIINYREIPGVSEVDIYLPKYQLAIEYNGLYWHSEGLNSPIDKNKHLNKTIKCLENNIELFHIFENEWENKSTQLIWKSKLNYYLGNSIKTIYARKTYIKEVEHLECKKFLNENHLQGSVNSSVRLGLYQDNTLISVMTFGKNRYGKNLENTYELLRFASLKNTRIIGGASKLLKNFIKLYKPKLIKTYADRRYSQGKLYKALGFTHTHSSKPSYFYWDKKGSLHLESRLKYQKHLLKNKLDNFDPKLSEVANMFNNGYRRIWDCGTESFTLEINTP